jgi:hypothetical protein
VLSHFIHIRVSDTSKSEVMRYSSYSSASALNGGEWSASRPSRALAQEKGPPVPTVQEAGWAPEPVWTQRLKEKYFRLCRRSNLDRPVVRPVARHYTDWATQFIISNAVFCIYGFCITLTPNSDISLNSVNQLIFVMVKCGVLFEVRTLK